MGCYCCPLCSGHGQSAQARRTERWWVPRLGLCGQQGMLGPDTVIWALTAETGRLGQEDSRAGARPLPSWTGSSTARCGRAARAGSECWREERGPSRVPAQTDPAEEGREGNAAVTPGQQGALVRGPPGRAAGRGAGRGSCAGALQSSPGSAEAPALQRQGLCAGPGKAAGESRCDALQSLRCYPEWHGFPRSRHLFHRA